MLAATHTFLYPYHLSSTVNPECVFTDRRSPSKSLLPQLAWTQRVRPDEWLSSHPAQLSLDQLSHLKLSTLQGSVEPARTWLSVNVCCEASASNSEIHFRSTRLRSVQTSQYSGLEGFSPGWICSHFTERSLFTGWSPTGNSSFPWWLKKKKKKHLNLFFSPRRRQHMSTWLTHSLLNGGTVASSTGNETLCQVSVYLLTSPCVIFYFLFFDDFVSWLWCHWGSGIRAGCPLITWLSAWCLGPRVKVSLGKTLNLRAPRMTGPSVLRMCE